MADRRAVFVVNPASDGGSTGKSWPEIADAARRHGLQVVERLTESPGHATVLAREAVAAGEELVVAVGGDGTVNEVVNGLLTDGPSDSVPALAVVPGGSTNVFARAIGLPRDPIDATSVLLEALREKRTRTIGLGMVSGRWFTFCAGIGLDAEVVRRVERARTRGKTASKGLYLRSAVTQYFMGTDRSGPLITLKRPGADAVEQLSMAIVQNTAPWTYLGGRGVNPSPAASFDTGLDLMALRALRLPSTLRAAAQILSPTPDPHGRRIYRLHDADELTLCAERPLAVQVDGDYIGERDELVMRSEPAALRVVV
jgi:diacylglycerol kinase family enzyme